MGTKINALYIKFKVSSLETGNKSNFKGRRFNVHVMFYETESLFYSPGIFQGRLSQRPLRIQFCASLSPYPLMAD